MTLRLTCAVVLLSCAAIAAEHGQEIPLWPGVIGFSASGELAALIETRFDAGDDSASDALERVSSRPDFAVIVYPGFRRGVISVPKDAPPTFLVCSTDDRSHAFSTVDLYMDLMKQGVSAEMHLYAAGGHGYALRPVDGPADSWEQRLLEWMVHQKLLNK